MFKKILCTADGSPASQKALDAAADLARKYAGQVTVLHVMPLPMLQLLAY
ncbi:MAG: universal stress protein, partial [Candidatus Eremiobacterota bacterium]